LAVGNGLDKLSVARTIGEPWYDHSGELLRADLPVQEAGPANAGVIGAVQSPEGQVEVTQVRHANIQNRGRRQRVSIGHNGLVRNDSQIVAAPYLKRIRRQTMPVPARKTRKDALLIAHIVV